MITKVEGRTRDGIWLFAGHKFGQGEGDLELDCVERDPADRQNVTPYRDRDEKGLGRRFQSDWSGAADLSVCYAGVDDETRIGSHILRDVGLVDWRATEHEERGVGRGGD